MGVVQQKAWSQVANMQHKFRPKPRALPFCGEVRLTAHSSLKKLMRAACRGLLPAERLGDIERAVKSVARHPEKFMNAHARRAEV